MIQVFFYLCTLIAGYVFLRGILPLQLHWGWKAGLAGLLSCAAFKFHILFLFGGAMFFSPELPRWLLVVTSWGFVTIFFLFLFLLVADFVRSGYLFYLLCRKWKKPESFRATNNRINLLLLSLCAFWAAIGLREATMPPQIRNEVILLDSLSTEFTGLRIVLLGDLHGDRITDAAYIEDVVRRTNALEPDLVAIVGDFVDGSVADRANDLRPLQKLSAKYGVFGIAGNHEYFSGYDEWMEFLPTLGIRMLLNEHVLLPEPGIAIAGVTDPAARRAEKEMPDLSKALNRLAPETPVILLAHRPDFVLEAAKTRRIALQLSGHTHGGVIRGFDRLVVAPFNAGFLSGLYRVEDTALYVTNGTSLWNGFPIRLGVPSEIVLLQLQKP